MLAATSISAALPHAVPFRATNRPSIHASTLEFGVYQESLWTLLFTGSSQRREENRPNGYWERNFDAMGYCAEHGAFVLFAHAR